MKLTAVALFIVLAFSVAGATNVNTDFRTASGGTPDWKFDTQLQFTTKIFRARGLHLDDRHIRPKGGGGFSASIVVSHNCSAFISPSPL